jgi:hypothetical protein
MPITFNCTCGKTLRVPDENAGRRAKCPACNAVLTVPAPEPVFEIVEEPEKPAIAPAIPIAPPKLSSKPKYEDDDEDDKIPYGLAKEQNYDDDDDDASSDDKPAQGTTRGPKKVKKAKHGLPNFRKGNENHKTS